jgi:hypothetical protein
MVKILAQEAQKQPLDYHTIEYGSKNQDANEKLDQEEKVKAAVWKGKLKRYS